MTAINSALEIDLTGQATAESHRQDVLQRHRRPGRLHARRDPVAGRQDHPGAPVHGRERRRSRASCPFLKEGAGVTLTRGDIHYVVTEYGIAYLHGKNIRERAMDLIAIAHPKFRRRAHRGGKERRTSSTRTRPSSRRAAASTPSTWKPTGPPVTGSTSCSSGR